MENVIRRIGATTKYALERMDLMRPTFLYGDIL